MNQSDVLYRAFSEYKKQTANDRECELQRKAVASSNPEADRIDVIRTICTIEEDWIEAIEKGLVHVEKAINEGRQFIRSRGEVVPIEKVKRVSKDSVKHLARHSELITKEHEGEDIIPDRLYIVERLSDFAVYENRFLYMLLLYLSSFIAHRYDKILEHTNTYQGGVTMNKSVAMNKRKLVFELKLSEEKKDDWYLKTHNELQSTINRIDLLLKTVMHFLATPLMQEVAKAPVLKPPITKTNVLKMNKNFKGAVALYDFVTAYDKPGYSVDRREERISPFPDNTSGEFAEMITLASFLTYKYGLGLNKFLKNSYEEEEERRKAEELQKQKEQLAKLRKRIAESGGNAEEYILLLEKHNKMLEADSAMLVAEKQENARLRAEAEALTKNIQQLNVTIEEKENEIGLLNQKYIDDMSALRSGHEKETAALKAQHQNEIEHLNSEHEDIISGLNEAHRLEVEKKDNQIEEIERKNLEEQEEHKRRLEEAETKTEEMQTEYRAEIEKLEKQNSDMTRAYEKLSDEKAFSDMRLNALRKEYNLIKADEDFTAKESFEELEHQYKVFKTFFKDEWKKTKKRIRKEILRPQPHEQKTGN